MNILFGDFSFHILQLHSSQWMLVLLLLHLANAVLFLYNFSSYYLFVLLHLMNTANYNDYFIAFPM